MSAADKHTAESMQTAHSFNLDNIYDCDHSMLCCQVGCKGVLTCAYCALFRVNMPLDCCFLKQPWRSMPCWITASSCFQGMLLLNLELCMCRIRSNIRAKSANLAELLCSRALHKVYNHNMSSSLVLLKHQTHGPWQPDLHNHAGCP